MRKISVLGWFGIMMLMGLGYLFVDAINRQGVKQTLIEGGVALIVMVGAGLFYKFVFDD